MTGRLKQCNVILWCQEEIYLLILQSSLYPLTDLRIAKMSHVGPMGIPSANDAEVARFDSWTCPMEDIWYFWPYFWEKIYFWQNDPRADLWSTWDSCRRNVGWKMTKTCSEVLAHLWTPGSKPALNFQELYLQWKSPCLQLWHMLGPWVWHLHRFAEFAGSIPGHVVHILHDPFFLVWLFQKKDPLKLRSLGTLAHRFVSIKLLICTRSTTYPHMLNLGRIKRHTELLRLSSCTPTISLETPMSSNTYCERRPAR